METKIFPEGLTRYVIKPPDTDRRVIYGFDPDTKADGWTGYYIEVKDSSTGATILMAGFTEDLSMADMLFTLDDVIPSKISEEEKELLDLHKINIAAGLPF